MTEEEAISEVEKWMVALLDHTGGAGGIMNLVKENTSNNIRQVYNISSKDKGKNKRNH